MAYTIDVFPASKADLDAVGQLIYDSIHGLAHIHYSPKQLNAWAPAPYAGEIASKRFGEQLLFIASDDEGMAALMTLTPKQYLDFAYAHPRCARKGAAGQAYSSLESYARAENMNSITSDVSLVARPFFEKRGYKILAKQHPIANGVTLTNFKMRKEFT